MKYALIIVPLFLLTNLLYAQKERQFIGKDTMEQKADRVKSIDTNGTISFPDSLIFNDNLPVDQSEIPKKLAKKAAPVLCDGVTQVIDGD